MKVDAHVHIFPQTVSTARGSYLRRDLTFRSLYSNPRSDLCSVEDLLVGMDEAAIDHAILANIGWVSHDLCQETNDYLIASAGHYPDRLTAFCAVNPAMGDAAVLEIERCGRLGAKGIGELHPDYQGFDIGDQSLMAPIMEAAARYRMPLLTHASEPVGHVYPGKGLVTPAVLYRFIENFPEALIILAHWGGGLPFYALMPEVRRAMGNVLFDTAASPFLYEDQIVEQVVDLVGAEKVLFATDFPLVSHKRMLEQVEASSLDRESKDMILGGNAARLLGLP